MKTKYNKVKYFISFVVLFGMGQVYAEGLSSDKIKSLIVGNTVVAKHLKKDFEFKVYFDVDGVTAYRAQNGETIKTTYNFEENKHCINWKGSNRCATVLDNGDGTYTRVNANGKQVVKWTNVVKGKSL